MSVVRICLSSVIGLGLLTGVAAVPAAADTFRFTAGSSHPVTALPWARALPELVVPKAAERAEALGHKIEWTEAYSGALYNFQNTLEGVEEGLADVGWVGSLWEPAKLPLQNVSFFAPFVTSDLKTLNEVGVKINTEIPEVAEAWTLNNNKLLGVFASEAYIMITKEPVTTIEDLDGKKLFTPGAVARWVEGTGAVGVDAGLPVYFEGIKNGVVDGAILPTTSVLPFKLFEVAPFVTVVDGLGGGISGALTMNLDTWNSMPPEMQEVFEEIGADYTAFVETELSGAVENSLSTLRNTQGVTVAELPREEMQKWANALPDIAGEWVASTGGPAAEVLQVFMDTTRANGIEPLRNWDEELSN